MFAAAESCRRHVAAAVAVTVACAVVGFTAPPARAASPFAWRGIVEGSYYAPWSHGARMRMLAWMPAHGFNAYVHAPKGDTYQRGGWARPYPADVQAQFDSEIAYAQAHGIEWIPNLSPAVPGLSNPEFCFSCRGDIAAVERKLRPFWAAGARTFMVSFDDVSQHLTRGEDVRAYGGSDAEALGRANADFLDRLDHALRSWSPDDRLLTVGSDYRGTGDSPYLRGLRAGAGLNGDIEVMWTGTNDPPRAGDISPSDAAAYGRWIGREPVVWENWTNTDGDPQHNHRIFLGPFAQRPDIAGAVRGFFFNPTNEADLNMLPFATAGDWMADPPRYDARSSWLRAVDEMAGSGTGLADALRAWAETSYGSTLAPPESPTFAALAHGFLGADGGPDWLVPWRTLLGELQRVEGAPDAPGQLPNSSFAAQASPYLQAARQSAAVGDLAAYLLAVEHPSIQIDVVPGGFSGRVLPPLPAVAGRRRAQLTSDARTMRANPRFTYGWRRIAGTTIPGYATPPRNVVDDFVAAVMRRDAAWQPNAARASRTVALTVDGRPVPLDGRGGFRLDESACGGRLVATDGIGTQTVKRLPACGASSPVR